jgi:hypothetical protein
MSGASVPKTPIDENGKPLFLKDEVRLSKNSHPAAPSVNFVSSKYAHQPQLSCGVSVPLYL